MIPLTYRACGAPVQGCGEGHGSAENANLRQPENLPQVQPFGFDRCAHLTMRRQTLCSLLERILD